MPGRQVNIYLQEQNYEGIREIVGPRQISSYINQLIGERLTQIHNQRRKEFQQKLITGYQRVAQSQALRREEAIREEAISDILK